MSMADRDGKIWKDGKLVDWRDAKIHVLTHTLHYGMGVFEGVRAYNTPNGTAIFRLQEHTERLFNRAKIFRMKIPFDMETVIEAQQQVVRENKLESCYMRPLVWIGSEKLGVSAQGQHHPPRDRRLAVGRLPRRGRHERGIRVKTSRFTRHHVNITMVQRQGGRQLHQLDPGQQEALADGYDEALLLDTERLRLRRLRRERVHRQERHGLHARPGGRCAGRHHAQHGAARSARDLGIEAGRKAHHARRDLHLPTKPSSPAPPPK